MPVSQFLPVPAHLPEVPGRRPPRVPVHGIQPGQEGAGEVRAGGREAECQEETVRLLTFSSSDPSVDAALSVIIRIM